MDLNKDDCILLLQALDSAPFRSIARAAKITELSNRLLQHIDDIDKAVKTDEHKEV